MTDRVRWLIVPALLLAACGGGDDDGASDASAETEWCDLARQIQDTDSAFDEMIGDDPESVRTAIDELQGVLDEAVGVAPDAIRADVDTSADSVDVLAALLDDAQYDVTRIEESSFAQLEELSAEMDAATARIQAYNESECGFAAAVDDEQAQATESSDSASTTSAPVSTESMEEFSGDPDSDWCVAARGLEDAGGALDAADFDFTDPEAVRAAFGDLVAAFERAKGVAPPEIAEAVSTSYEGVVRLDTELAAVEYDFLRADLSAIEELDAEMDLASEQISTYNDSVCGIPADDAGADATAGGETSGGNDDSFDPTAGSIRDQTIAQLTASGFTEEEAGCMFDNIDLTDPTLGTDMSVIVEVFEVCGIDVTRLAELGG